MERARNEGGTIDIKNEDMFRQVLDGMDFIVKKIVNDMAVLEYEDGKRQILTGVNTLKLNSFYLKNENKDQ